MRALPAYLAVFAGLLSVVWVLRGAFAAAVVAGVALVVLLAVLLRSAGEPPQAPPVPVPDDTPWGKREA